MVLDETGKVRACWFLFAMIRNIDFIPSVMGSL